LPDGWASDVRIEIAGDGTIAGVVPGGVRQGAERLAGICLPGMPNLHSHAFQRAMAGLGERAGPGADTFWTWREVMYRFVARLEPDDVRAIAAQLYVEMLKAGYTAVGEFHYLHLDRDGRPYDDPAAMSWAIVEAAAAAGIALTHLPVLYAADGFGGVAPHAGQRRFVLAVDDLLAIVEAVHRRATADANLAVGLAPHSLRAVPPEELAAGLAGLDAIDPGAPVHIHIAEQVREVEECLDWCGARPVEWLLANAPVSPRWCLVHATHMSAAETDRAARSGAVAGLCPTTEANLGDGLFPLRRYLEGSGRIGIGSDSHVSVSPVEELRWLEYGQRLHTLGRNLAALEPGASTGAALFMAALAGGAQALSRETGAIAPGRRADVIVLDADHPNFAGRTGDDLLDAWLFSGNAPLARDVMVGGRWVVRDGRHDREDAVARDYRETVARLLAND